MPVVAIAAAVAIAQYYQAEQARGANKKRLKEIEAMFDAISPPDLNVWDDPALIATVPEPMFNLQNLTPEQYESVGQYIPEVADYVQERNPELVQATAAANEGRQAQLDALRQYRQIAEGGFDPELQQGLNQASERANREAQSRSASILQDAQRRGMGGSGIALGAQLNASGNAMSQASRDSMLAATESYRNRLNAMDQSAQLGGNIRGSEMAEESRNVGIINDFNQRTSKAYQDWQNMRANTANQAQLRNLDTNQRIADANVANRNKSAVDERDYANQMSQQMYGNKRQTRNDKMDVVERQNKVRQQLYDNLMAKAAGKAGVGYQRMQMETQNAQDKNQAVRGLGDAATAGYLYSNSQPKQTQQQSVMPQYQPMADDYDEGTTTGNYRYADSDRWRTA